MSMSQFDLRNLIAKIKKLEAEVAEKDREIERLSSFVRQWIKEGNEQDEETAYGGEA